MPYSIKPLSCYPVKMLGVMWSQPRAVATTANPAHLLLPPTNQRPISAPAMPPICAALRAWGSAFLTVSNRDRAVTSISMSLRPLIPPSILLQRKPPAIFSHFSPILLSPKSGALLYTAANSVCQGRPRCAAARNRGNSSLGRRTARARERTRGGVHVPYQASRVHSSC